MSLQLLKNSQLSSILEWNKIKEKLSLYSHFDNTVNQRVLKDLNLSQAQKYIKKTALISERLYDSELNFIKEQVAFLDPDESIGPIIEKLSKSALLKLSQLHELAHLIEFFLNSHINLKELEVGDLAHPYNEFKNYMMNNFLKEFRTFYSKDGDIDFLKHPQLRLLYQTQIEIEANIRKTISRILQQYKESIQFNSYDIINDRFVIPIKTNSYQSKIGQIISRSDTGHTLYVEPFEIKDLNIKRLETILKLEKIIVEIERKYTQVLVQKYESLEQIKWILFEFDNLLTRANFAHANDYVLPELSNELIFSVKEMFHPLIIEPVKNDIELNHGQGLVISGPNTGGKTASLKSIALISIFSRFGLAVPASKAKLCFFDEIFYFGDDRQSLIDGLSSFAGEVTAYNSMLNSFKENNLILIDEIFNSTSSEEASALAISFFEEIKRISNSQIIVSTHHQMLKTFIQQKEDFVSAHVGFDTKTNAPTYKLHFGIPGASQALSIFKKISKGQHLSEKIYKNALKYLDNKIINYEKVLSEVAKKENELHKLLNANREKEVLLKNKEASMEGVLKLKMTEKLKHFEKKAEKILSKAQQALRDSKLGKIPTTRQLNKQAHEINKEIKSLVPKAKQNEQDPYKDLKVPSQIVPGDSYFSTFLKQTVKVKKIERNKVIVQKGSMTIACPLNSLRIAHGHEKNRQLSQQETINFTSRESKIEYDCRGMRLEEFQNLVESAIGDLFSHNVPFITFIHGHGTGVLKNWFRNFIKLNKDLKVVPTETGNDGETKISLID